MTKGYPESWDTEYLNINQIEELAPELSWEFIPELLVRAGNGFAFKVGPNTYRVPIEVAQNIAQARKECDVLKQALEQLEKACGKLCINQNNHSREVFHEFGNAYNNAVHVLIFNEPEQPA